MKSYIGSKIIKAIEMTDMDFEKERAIYNEANHLTKAYKNGYSLLHTGGECCGSGPVGHRDPKDGYKIMYPDGYISWSPANAFEQAYRLVGNDEKELIKKEM